MRRYLCELIQKCNQRCGRLKNPQIHGFTRLLSTPVPRLTPIPISQDAIDAWRAPMTGKRGAQPVYADFAIETALALRLLFHLLLRQTDSFFHIPTHLVVTP